MGYQTNYEIEVSLRDLPKGIKGASLDLTDILQELRNIEPNENFEIRNIHTIATGEECLWYHYNEHMKAISNMFSGMLFTVTGSGEEPGDLWRKYYYNGLVQDSVLIFSPFDLEAAK